MIAPKGVGNLIADGSEVFAAKMKAKLLSDFDKQLQKQFRVDLYSFVAIIKLEEGESFHHVVDVIFERDGAIGLRKFFDGLVVMLDGFKMDNSN